MAIINSNLQEAIKWLNTDLVALPTETVYGLAANATNVNLVSKIFEVKNRPTFDPLIVHFADKKSVFNYIESFSETLNKLADLLWPGPLTLLLPKNNLIPDLVTSGSSLLGARVPAHPLIASLLQQIDFPLAAPSANPFGYISPTSAQHVDAQLGDKIPFILDGGSCEVGIESTIVGEENGQLMIYRLGGISIEQIQAAGFDPVLKLNQSSNPIAPGMLKKHYSPRKKIWVAEAIDDLIKENADKKIALLTFQDKLHFDVKHRFVLSSKGDLKEAASHIFEMLRLADDCDADLIIAQLLPEVGLGRAINDRLLRSAAKA